jgi:hypothetical protein
VARGARDGQRAERSGGTGTRLYAALGVFPLSPALLPSSSHPFLPAPVLLAPYVVLCPSCCIPLRPFSPSPSLLSPLLSSSRLHPPPPTLRVTLSPSALVACPLAVALVSPFLPCPLAHAACAPPLLSFALSSLSLSHFRFRHSRSLPLSAC